MLQVDKNKVIDFDEKINAAVEQLKKEFFGIDEQIQQIADNIRPWFYFSNLQDRPIIINLWGLTGCGKTSLVTRFTELLGLSYKTKFFNFASISESSSYDIEQMIEKNMSDMGEQSPVIVYDEIQYARTIGGMGKELDKQGLKPFWELLDSGKIIVRYDYYTKYCIKKAYDLIKLAKDADTVEIKNGVITKGIEYLQDNLQSDVQSSRRRYNTPKKLSSKKKKEVEEYEEESSRQEETIFDSDTRKSFYEVLNSKFPEKYKGINMVFDDIQSKDKNELFDYVEKIYEYMMEDKVIDMHRALIFVLGNIDEAYQIADSIDPDISCDDYHRFTKKIKETDIKQALQKRFRNEQIARLGNIHLIYPSFNSKTYKAIINGRLEKYAEDVKTKYNVEIKYTEAIRTIIFKDGVFPTQGTRPVFSSIYEIVCNKFPMILSYSFSKDIKFDTLKYDFAKKSSSFVCRYILDGKEVGTFRTKQNLRIESHRVLNHDDKQAITAVHESGHAIVNYALFGYCPSKITCVTVGVNGSGFITISEKQSDASIPNLQNIINQVAVLVAGRAAEYLVFGEKNITSGASSDLRQAQNMLFSAFQYKGLGEIELENGAKGGYDTLGNDTKIMNPNSDREILDAFDKAKALAYEILQRENKLFMVLTKTVEENGTLYGKELERIFSENYSLKDSKPLEEEQSEIYRKRFENFLENGLLFHQVAAASVASSSREN